MIEVWVYGNRPECVGHHRSIAEARRACQNDAGRLLTIIDAIGRVHTMYRDGAEV